MPFTPDLDPGSAFPPLRSGLLPGACPGGLLARRALCGGFLRRGGHAGAGRQGQAGGQGERQAPDCVVRGRPPALSRPEKEEATHRGRFRDAAVRLELDADAGDEVDHAVAADLTLCAGRRPFPGRWQTSQRR